MCAQKVFEVIFKANGFFDFNAFEPELDVIHCSQIIRVDHGDDDLVS